MHVTAHDEDGPQEAEPDFRYIAADDSGPEDGGRAELVMGAAEESHCGGAPTPTPGDCLNRYMAPIRPVSRPQTQPPPPQGNIADLRSPSESASRIRNRSPDAVRPAVQVMAMI
jgi:hypothetical protein